MSSSEDKNNDVLNMVPNCLSDEIDANAFAHQEREHERNSVEQRFTELDSEIFEMTTLVTKVLQRDSPGPREENGLNAITTLLPSRFDKGVCLSLNPS